MKKTIVPLGCIVIACLLIDVPFAAERPVVLKTTENACFERSYSDTHLKKHPKQKVRWMRIEHAISSSEFNYAVIKARFVGDRRLFSDGGACFMDESGKLVCDIDCDGGGYTLSERDDGNVVLRPLDRIRVTECGDDDDQPYRQILASDDQEAFVLERVPAEKCMLKAID